MVDAADASLRSSSSALLPARRILPTDSDRGLALHDLSGFDWARREAETGGEIVRSASQSC